MTDAVTFHSAIATAFDDSYRADPNRLERLTVWRDTLSRHAGHARLAYDIGCGSGRLTPLLATRAEQVVAIDGSPAMLDLARRHAAAERIGNVRFREARLPIADLHGLDRAEIVIASSVIEYLPSLPDAVRFLKALTLPGGLLVFSVSNRDSINRRLVQLTSRLFDRPRYFRFIRHLIDPAVARGLVADAGLELVELRYFDGRNRVNSLLSPLVGPRHASNMLLVAARRPLADVSG